VLRSFTRIPIIKMSNILNYSDCTPHSRMQAVILLRIIERDLNIMTWLLHRRVSPHDNRCGVYMSESSPNSRHDSRMEETCRY
jgi:hypothetical protein